MGVSKTVTVVCDLPGCTSGGRGPQVLSWNETEVEKGTQPIPELAKYLVILSVNGTQKSFCCQLHAAEFFLPPGWEMKQKQVVPFPVAIAPEPEEEAGDNWMSLPPRVENPLNGQESE